MTVEPKTKSMSKDFTVNEARKMPNGVHLSFAMSKYA
jgi:hypothetical protein